MEETATYTGPQCFQPATLLFTAAWEQELEAHPDPAFSHYILSGLQQGFHIGADRACRCLRPGPGNFPSARQHPQLIHSHIAKEVQAGRLLGPLPGHLVPLCHCRPIGLIPKPHQPGKWRLIVDLSSPAGHSAISNQVTHMHYEELVPVVMAIAM